MVIFCIYTILLLMMIFILANCVQLVDKVPIKIRSVFTMVIGALFVRYVALFILLIAQNIKYLYCLQPLIFLNMLAIPIGAIVCFYIFIKNNSIKFNYIFLVIAILIVLYILMIFICPVKVQISDVFGYKMGILNSKYIYGVNVLINLIILIYAVILIIRKIGNKIGYIFIILSSTVTLLGILNIFIKLTIMPIDIVSDIMWMICIIYSIKTLC